MNFTKAMNVAEALLKMKATDRVEISSDEGKWHVGCYGFATRAETEKIVEISKTYKTRYELARDGFDLW